MGNTKTLINGGIRREDIERLVRLEATQEDMGKDMSEVKIDVAQLKEAVHGIGRAMAVNATENTEQQAQMLEQLKAIKNNHKSLRLKVTGLGLIVGGLAGSASAKAADFFHWLTGSK